MDKSSQKHTPGPWTFAPDLSAVVVVQDHRVRAVADFGKIDLPETEANARLIAAAPETATERDRLKNLNAELVTAIKGLLVEVDAYLDYARAGDTDRGMDDAADVVKMVLTRAEGSA